MQKINNKQRLGLIIFSIFVLFISLEILLRVSGLVFLLSRGQINNKFKRVSSDYVILCLGDSFTNGVGAERGEDYPTQLDNLLDKLSYKKKFIVVNKGIPGQNTSELLAELDENINTYMPDLIIVLSGMNDGSNSHLHYKALKKHNFFDRLNSWASELRIYKLARYLRLSSQNKYSKAEHSKKGQEYIPADVEEIKELVNNKRYVDLEKLMLQRMTGNNKWVYINIAKEINSPKILEHVMERGLTLIPGDDVLRLALAKFYWSQNKLEKAESLIKYILCTKPKDHNIRFELAEFYASQNRCSEAEGLMLEQIALYGQSHRVYLVLEKCRSKYLNKSSLAYINVTNINMANIKKKIQDKGINLIMMNYPLNNIVNKSVTGDAIFLDNYMLFGNMPPEKKAILFSADGYHCNGSGYRVMAENLLKCMLENNLLN